MPTLKIRRLPLRFETEQANRDKIHAMRRKNRYRVALTIGLPPENRIVDLIYTAITKKVEVLKTNDVDLLQYAAVIQKEFSIEVIKCA